MNLMVASAPKVQTSACCCLRSPESVRSKEHVRVDVVRHRVRHAACAGLVHAGNAQDKTTLNLNPQAANTMKRLSRYTYTNYGMRSTKL